MTESATPNGGAGDGSLSAGHVALADADLALQEMRLPEMRMPDMVRPRVTDSQAPRHCGTPMEWRSPEPGAMASYSFEPAGHSAALPALWRCRCGFQLDGVDQRAASLAAAYWHSR